MADDTNHAPRPHVEPIQLSSVYECDSPTQADAILGGALPGYVYSRDGHPNAAALAERCRVLHNAERCVVTNSGMSALALVLVTQCQAGDHLLLSRQLYGRSYALFQHEAARLGITADLVDTLDPQTVARAWRAKTKLLVVETITNPTLRVNPLSELAAVAHARGGLLLVDNTLAGPLNCRPLAWGADLVVESLTKIMNGHSDVLLGALCGPASLWERVPTALSTWGWTAPPFECWLASRGMATYRLRWQAAADNAWNVAAWLKTNPAVARVDFSGMPDHPDYDLAKRLFAGTESATGQLRTGTLVTFTLQDVPEAAERFIAAVADRIPFCPSLGEYDTTLSHPASTSHRALDPTARTALGISDGTIRLSVGSEPYETILAALVCGLSAISA